MSQNPLPVIVIGAGPIGLAAAAHLLEHGLDPLILEAGSEPAAAIARWDHVQLFSPWAINLDPASIRLLGAGGWERPAAEEHPSGRELRERYLIPLAALPPISSRLRLNHRVIAVGKRQRDGCDRGTGSFELLVDTADGESRLLASAVVDASGALDTPNPLGASGIPALGERQLSHRIAYGIPPILGEHAAHYADRRVLVVGSGHSAMHVLNDLATLRRAAPHTCITWAIRRPSAPAVTTGGDTLPARAALARNATHLIDDGTVALRTGTHVEALRDTPNGIVVVARETELGPFDRIVAATGFRPDLAMLRELRLELDPVIEAPVRIAPLIDPALHTCATVPLHGASQLEHPERGFYIAGMKSYGRAPTFLLSNGYEQVRSIAATLAGRPAISSPPDGLKARPVRANALNATHACEC